MSTTYVRTSGVSPIGVPIHGGHHYVGGPTTVVTGGQVIGAPHTTYSSGLVGALPSTVISSGNFAGDGLAYTTGGYATGGYTTGGYTTGGYTTGGSDRWGCWIRFHSRSHQRREPNRVYSFLARLLPTTN